MVGHVVSTDRKLRDECRCSPFLSPLFLFSFRTPALGMALPVFRSGLLSSAILLWKQTLSCMHRKVSRVIPKARKIDNKDKSIYQNDFPLLPGWLLSWALCLKLSSSWVAFKNPHKKRADTIHMASGLRSISFNNHSPWYWRDNSYTMRLIYSLTTSSCRPPQPPQSVWIT